MTKQEAVAVAWKLSDFSGSILTDFVNSDGEIWLEEDRQNLLKYLRENRAKDPNKAIVYDGLISYVSKAILDGDGGDF